jgi:hypothetical protein
MAIWAMRELLRRPLSTLLLFFGLSTTVALVGLVLAFGQSMRHTCHTLLEASPTIVLRRVNSGGWSPLPVDDAMTYASQVPGVLRPRPRYWGTVMDADGLVRTIVAQPSHATLDPVVATLLPGQTALGPGLRSSDHRRKIWLSGSEDLELDIVHRLPSASAMAAYDVVVVHIDDARRLLGLAPGHASDLAMDVFRSEEVPTICVELSEAFPWPVHIMTRQSRMDLCLETVTRQGGIVSLGFFPALLSLAYLVVAVGRLGEQQRRSLGLLKALGWSAGDIFKIQFYRIGLLAFGAAVLGLAMAYGLLYMPPLSAWLSTMFGWPGPSTILLPSIGALIGAFAWTLLLVVVPFYCAGMWCARRAALADPADMLNM